jgi:hypothetical protein
LEVEYFFLSTGSTLRQSSVQASSGQAAYGLAMTNWISAFAGMTDNPAIGNAESGRANYF